MAKTKAQQSTLSSRFTPAAVNAKRRIVATIEGIEGTGKTYLALTAPGPVALLNFDLGTADVIDQFVGTKEIGIAEFEQVSGAAGKKGEAATEAAAEAAQAIATKIRLDFEATFLDALQTARTVVVDTASELWGIYRLSRFGRVSKVPPGLYEEVNSDFKRLIRQAMHSDSNVLFIHHLKDVWENGDRTGALDLSGFHGMKTIVPIRIQATAQKRPFNFQLVKCRPQVDLTGMEFEEPTFAELATMIYPDTEEEYWS